MIMADYFNAAHSQWGYTYKTKRGTLLAQAAEGFQLILLSHPESPTRTGASTARDTTPDLSFSAGNLDVIWTSTPENLGSHHNIVQLAIQNNHYNVKTGVARITNWDAFQKATSSCSIDTIEPY